MIITDRFVFLDNPGTGSAFVRTVLKRVHEGPPAAPRSLLLSPFRFLARRDAAFTELLLPNVRANGRRTKDSHGTYSQIPWRHRAKEVVGVVRNPFERLLSTHRSREWAKHPGVDRAVLADRLPHFPDLTLDELLGLEDLTIARRVPGMQPGLDIGLQTIEFIEMFFEDPQRVLRRLDRGYLSSDRFLVDLPPIRFLRTEYLNRELHELLLEAGHPAEQVAWVLHHQPGRATPSAEADWPWSDLLIRRVMRRERLLFRILRHLGFEYGIPRERVHASV